MVFSLKRSTAGAFAVPFGVLRQKHTVFPPEHAIAGIPHYNQRWPPEKRKKGQFGPFLLQDCRLNTGIIF